MPCNAKHSWTLSLFLFLLRQKGVLFEYKWPQRPSRDGARSREAPQTGRKVSSYTRSVHCLPNYANWIARSENKAKRGVRSDCEWPQSSPCACVMAFSGTRLIESHTGHRHFQRWVCLGANYCLANMRAVVNFTQSCAATTQGSVLQHIPKQTEFIHNDRW